MTSNELATECAIAVMNISGRVNGVGKQYQTEDGKEQDFEFMTVDEICDMTIEELDDTIAYTVMMRIQLRRLQERVKRLEKQAESGNVPHV